MTKVLRNACFCGGDVAIITTREKNERTGKKEEIVSHGTCLSCNENKVFAPDTLIYFISGFSRSELYNL